MVTRSYMLAKPKPPGRAKLLLDQRIIPLAIDAAGAFEVSLQRLSKRTGIRPLVLIGMAAGAAGALLAMARKSRRA